MSTESGIPDYRSPEGSYSKGHKPLTHMEFVNSLEKRKRYWARAVVAQKYFTSAKPNLGHFALADLEKMGHVSELVTQNVDRLHSRAGSQQVLELHGHAEGVSCLNCGTEYNRQEYQDKILKVNRDWFTANMNPKSIVDIRADGDAHLDVSDFQEFHVPGCILCDGTLMPTIVFFGGNVPESVRDRSFTAVNNADKLLVCGSSLTVWSSFRLCKAAHKGGKEIAIINVGETRADSICDFKVDDVSCATMLSSLMRELKRH